MKFVMYSPRIVIAVVKFARGNVEVAVVDVEVMMPTVGEVVAPSLCVPEVDVETRRPPDPYGPGNT